MICILGLIVIAILLWIIFFDDDDDFGFASADASGSNPNLYPDSYIVSEYDRALQDLIQHRNDYETNSVEGSIESFLLQDTDSLMTPHRDNDFAKLRIIRSQQSGADSLGRLGYRTEPIRQTSKDRLVQLLAKERLMRQRQNLLTQKPVPPFLPSEAIHTTGYRSLHPEVGVYGTNGTNWRNSCEPGSTSTSDRVTTAGLCSLSPNVGIFPARAAGFGVKAESPADSSTQATQADTQISDGEVPRYPRLISGGTGIGFVRPQLQPAGFDEARLEDASGSSSSSSRSGGFRQRPFSQKLSQMRFQLPVIAEAEIRSSHLEEEMEARGGSHFDLEEPCTGCGEKVTNVPVVEIAEMDFAEKLNEEYLFHPTAAEQTEPALAKGSEQSYDYLTHDQRIAKNLMDTLDAEQSRHSVSRKQSEYVTKYPVFGDLLQTDSRPHDETDASRLKSDALLAVGNKSRIASAMGVILGSNSQPEGQSGKEAPLESVHGLVAS